MVEIKDVSSAAQITLNDKIVTYIAKRSRGKKDVSRDDFIRDLGKEFRGVGYSDIKKGISDIAKNGYIKLEWVGVEDFRVMITEKGVEYILSNEDLANVVGKDNLNKMVDDLRFSKKNVSVMEIVDQESYIEGKKTKDEGNSTVTAPLEGSDNVSEKKYDVSQAFTGDTNNLIDALKKVAEMSNSITAREAELAREQKGIEQLKEDLAIREKKLQEAEQKIDELLSKEADGTATDKAELEKLRKIIDEKEAIIKRLTEESTSKDAEFSSKFMAMEAELNDFKSKISKLEHDSEAKSRMIEESNKLLNDYRYKEDELKKMEKDLKEKADRISKEGSEIENIKSNLEMEKDILLQHELDLSTREYSLEDKQRQLAMEFDQLATEKNKRYIIVNALEKREAALNERLKAIEQKDKAINIVMDEMLTRVTTWLEKIEKTDLTLHSYLNSAEDVKKEIENIKDTIKKENYTVNDHAEQALKLF